MKHNKDNSTDHAPGRGSDKQHPDTPPDANERFDIEENREKENDNKNK